jgi:type IV pilus assembly protein PilP
MNPASRHLLSAALVVGTALTALGCGDKVQQAAPPPPTQRGTQNAAPIAAATNAVKAAEYTENDFVENDRNRDPFRSYVTLFVEKHNTPQKIQRYVVLEQYSIDELKLVAIVTGGDYPRAMLVDPTTKGWVVKRGDFLGRPDVVHTGGTNGTDYQLNWRVDRVRDGDVVLIREDPAQPGIAPATRVIPLHPEQQTKDKEASL